MMTDNRRQILSEIRRDHEDWASRYAKAQLEVEQALRHLNEMGDDEQAARCQELVGSFLEDIKQHRGFLQRRLDLLTAIQFDTHFSAE